MERNSREAIRELVGGDFLKSYDAQELLFETIRFDDLTSLIRAYAERPHYLVRISIVDLVGQINSKESREFLLMFAKRREHWLVRYYAIRNLIELHEEGWMPRKKQALSSSFYASLLAYRDFIEGRISRSEIQRLAQANLRAPGSHWEWLANL